MTSDLLPGPVPLPALLAGGATVVVGTAAALTGRAAVRPELPSSRWHRRLPRTTAVVDRPTTRTALAVTGLAATIATLAALVLARTPVDGTVAVPVLVAAALAFGPLLPLVDPVRLLDRLPATARPGAPPRTAPPAVARGAVLGALTLATDDGRVLAAALAAHLATRVLLALRHGPGARRPDGVLEALAGLVGPLAPIGRDASGRLAWRNPLVSAAHAVHPLAAAWLTAVLVGLALHVGGVGAGPQALLTAAGAALAARGVLRLAIIRDWFSGVLAPLAAAYGLLASGGWLAPLDVVAFVGLHAVAMAVLHRAALARHDLRTARAVQLPPRIAVLVSVLAGLAATTAASSG
jgi:hypothetical protein